MQRTKTKRVLNTLASSEGSSVALLEPMSTPRVHHVPGMSWVTESLLQVAAFHPNLHHHTAPPVRPAPRLEVPDPQPVVVSPPVEPAPRIRRSEVPGFLLTEVYLPVGSAPRILRSEVPDLPLTGIYHPVGPAPRIPRSEVPGFPLTGVDFSVIPVPRV